MIFFRKSGPERQSYMAASYVTSQKGQIVSTVPKSQFTLRVRCNSRIS